MPDTGRLTDEQFAVLAEALSDPDPGRLLPAAERAEYERCCESVVEARRAGERIARELWIG